MKSLFLVCLGIFAGTAFCMKWLESSFYSNGSLFTIIGLEISYPREEIYSILSGLNDKVRTLLQSHLYFDFAFMVGVYPGLMLLCLMARDRIRSKIGQHILSGLGFSQILAFACDIYENYCLLTWIDDPGSIGDLTIYHAVVITKWLLALAAAVIAIPLSLRKRYVRTSYTN